VRALQALGLCTEELTAVWAVLASVLQLGNICFSSSEVSFRGGAGLVVWLVCITGGNLRVQEATRRASLLSRKVDGFPSFFFYKFIHFNWRLITLQYCSGFGFPSYKQEN